MADHSTVKIRENHPFFGRVTIYYVPGGAFAARSMELPKTAFMAALGGYLEGISPASSSSSVGTSESPLGEKRVMKLRKVASNL